MLRPYFCDVTYETKAGRLHGNQLTVFANSIDEASDIARERTKADKRRQVRRVYGGTTVALTRFRVVATNGPTATSETIDALNVNIAWSIARSRFPGASITIREETDQ
jgi:hypothetical protein